MLGSAYERPVEVLILKGDAIDDTDCTFCIVIVSALAGDRGEPLTEAEDSGNVEERLGLPIYCCIATYNKTLVMDSNQES